MATNLAIDREGLGIQILYGKFHWIPVKHVTTKVAENTCHVSYIFRFLDPVGELILFCVAGPLSLALTLKNTALQIATL